MIRNGVKTGAINAKFAKVPFFIRYFKYGHSRNWARVNDLQEVASSNLVGFIFLSCWSRTIYNHSPLSLPNALIYATSAERKQ
jgi:hypothetical protein